MTESCAICGKEVKATPNGIAMRAHMRTHNRKATDIGAEATSPAESPLDQSVPVDPFGGPASPAEEPAPVRPKRSIKDRLWGSAPSGKSEQAPTAPTSERRPQRPKRSRVDASRMLGDLWEWGGRKLEQKLPGYTPAARAIQAEASAAGPIVADLVKDTVADRPTQFLARHYEAGSAAVSLFALPLYVQQGGVELTQEGSISVGTRRRIEECIVDLAPSMVKWAKREQKRRADVEASLEEMRDLLGIPPGEPVTFDHLMGFFYPVVQGPIPASSRERVA